MMAAYGVVLPYVGIAFGLDVGGRSSEAERFASFLSATSSLNDVVQRSLNVDCGLF
jgi:hypothetical protein